MDKGKFKYALIYVTPDQKGPDWPQHPLAVPEPKNSPDTFNCRVTVLVRSKTEQGCYRERDRLHRSAFPLFSSDSYGDHGWLSMIELGKGQQS